MTLFRADAATGVPAYAPPAALPARQAVPPPSSFPIYAEICGRFAGLKFLPEKAYLLQPRLSGIMRREGCANLDELARRIGAEPARLEQDVAEAMLNNETFFFRDRAPFDEMAASVLPRLKAARQHSRRLRIWSAACSTGQEPYSLAMMFAEQRAAWADWGIEILGTDLSRTALARAKSGLYTQFEVQRGLSTARLLEHFSKEGEQWRLNGDVRSRVRFLPRNLTHPFPGGERFDIIFVRNVLMYFDAKRKIEVLTRLRSMLAPDGLMILGAAETSFGAQDLLRPAPECRGYYAPVAPTKTTPSLDNLGTASRPPRGHP